MPAVGIEARRIRVVVAKPGLDGHDRGAKIIARALRDAGMEVIYTGLHQTPEQIVETVIQEDADAVGLSILSGAHMTLVPRVIDLLAEQGIDDVAVTVGGTIPAEDITALERLGVAAVFTPGASTERVVELGGGSDQNQPSTYDRDSRPLRAAEPLAQQNGAHQDRHQRVRRRSGCDERGLSVSDAEVEQHVAAGIEQSDQDNQRHHDRRGIAPA
jgi:methylmalonyl-CoA mutase, C-terminal domain